MARGRTRPFTDEVLGGDAVNAQHCAPAPRARVELDCGIGWGDGGGAVRMDLAFHQHRRKHWIVQQGLEPRGGTTVATGRDCSWRSLRPSAFLGSNLKKGRSGLHRFGFTRPPHTLGLTSARNACPLVHEWESQRPYLTARPSNSGLPLIALSTGHCRSSERRAAVWAA